MKVVFFILFIFLVVLFLLWLISSKYKVLLLLSSKQRSAYFSLNHRIFSIVQGKVIVLADGSISVVTKKNKMIEKRVPSEYSKIFALEVIKITKINNVNIFVNSGQVFDAFNSSLIAGVLEVFGGVGEAILSANNINTKIIHDVNLKSDETSIAVDLNIKISLLRFLFALFTAKRKYKKQKENAYAN